MFFNIFNYVLKPSRFFLCIKLVVPKDDENVAETAHTELLQGEVLVLVQGGSNMTGTDVARFIHKQSRLYLNHLVIKN